jgi:hypothetical protein
MRLRHHFFLGIAEIFESLGVDFAIAGRAHQILLTTSSCVIQRNKRGFEVKHSAHSNRH